MSNVFLKSIHRTALTFARPLFSRFTFYNGQVQSSTLRRSDVRSTSAVLPLSSLPLPRVCNIRSSSTAIQTRSFTSSSCLFVKTNPPRIFNTKQLRDAFGQDVEQSIGNQVLRRLQKRRTSGSLVERGIYIQDCDLSHESLTQALEWLRNQFPLDEQDAAERWSSQTVERLEDNYDRQARKLGLIQGDPTEPSAANQDVYSRPGNRSVQDEIKILRAQQAEAEEKWREETGEAQREREVQLVKAEDAKNRAVERAEKRQKLEEDAYAFSGDQIPQMTLGQRLIPSFIFTVVVLALLSYCSEKYVPPTAARRLWSEIPPSVATMLGLGASMACITTMWHVPKFWKILNRNFINVSALPNPVALIGNIFSHPTYGHLAINMTCLSLYGISLHEDIGRGNFLAIFIGGGCFGSLTSLVYHAGAKMFHVSSTGASGGLMAIISAWIYLNAMKDEGPMAAETPFAKFMKLCGYSFPALQFALHFLPGVTRQIDVWSHAGGFIVGLMAAILLQDRMKRSQKKQAEKVKAGGSSVGT